MKTDDDAQTVRQVALFKLLQQRQIQRTKNSKPQP